jgi:hypothetical protein
MEGLAVTARKAAEAENHGNEQQLEREAHRSVLPHEELCITERREIGTREPPRHETDVGSDRPKHEREQESEDYAPGNGMNDRPAREHCNETRSERDPWTQNNKEEPDSGIETTHDLNRLSREETCAQA